MSHAMDKEAFFWKIMAGELATAESRGNAGN
jgi:hypothetical protein